MWKQIAESMLEMRYNVIPLQVENKFKTLERQYKKVVSNNNKTGRDRKTCSYESELSKLIGHKHSIIPIAVSSGEGLRVQLDAIAPNNQDVTEMSQLTSHVSKLIPHSQLPTEIENTITQQQSSTNKCKQSVGTTAKLISMCTSSIEESRKDRREQCKSRDQFHSKVLKYMKTTPQYNNVKENYRY